MYFFYYDYSWYFHLFHIVLYPYLCFLFLYLHLRFTYNMYYSIERKSPSYTCFLPLRNKSEARKERLFTRSCKVWSFFSMEQSFFFLTPSLFSPLPPPLPCLLLIFPSSSPRFYDTSWKLPIEFSSSSTFTNGHSRRSCEGNWTQSGRKFKRRSLTA